MRPHQPGHRALRVETALTAASVSARAGALIDAPPDVDVLANLVVIRSQVSQLEPMVVTQLRIAGHSWDAIASVLQVTRQSAHRRLSRSSDSLLYDLGRREANAGYLQERRREWLGLVTQLRQEVEKFANFNPTLPNVRDRDRP